MLKYIQFGLIGILVLAIFATLNFARETPGIFTSAEMYSPKDRITEEQIEVFTDKVVLNIENPQWAGFADTNSMDPFIDSGANSIEIKPNSASEIEVGDVISYHYGEDLVVHRVIMTGEDKEGMFYLVKGDNNTQPDPEKVRFEQVNGVLVAVIY